MAEQPRGESPQEILTQEESERLRTAMRTLVERLELRQLTRAAQSMVGARAQAQEPVIICVSGCA